jgi:hypothetical protein
VVYETAYIAYASCTLLKKMAWRRKNRPGFCRDGNKVIILAKAP